MSFSSLSLAIGMFCIIYVGLAESCDMSRDDLDSPMVPICQNKFQGSFQFVLIAELSLQLFSPSQSWQDILSLLFPGQWNDNNMQLERHKKVVGPLIFWEFILEIDWNVVCNNKSALKHWIMHHAAWADNACFHDNCSAIIMFSCEFQRKVVWQWNLQRGAVCKLELDQWQCIS